MTREDALRILRNALPGMKERYGVHDLAIFGSVARDEARSDSDVDVLVEFEPGHAGGFFKFFNLQKDLETCLGCPVDLVTPAALKRQLKDRILAEAIHAT